MASTAIPTTPRILPHVYTLGFKFGQFVADIRSAAPLFGSSETLYRISHFPVWYKEWWLQLLRDDPVHVLVETTLLAAILYFLLSRRRSRQGWKDLQRLTVAEEEELLAEWKQNRLPIVPASDTSSSTTGTQRSPIVVHSTNGRTMDISTTTNNGTTATPATRTTILNFATMDFLGMQSKTHPHDPTQPHPVQQASLAALDRYGCGSCGPRGFYGTIDVHLQLEQAVAAVTHSADAILYSDAASAVTSTVTAFLQRGDEVIVHRDAYEPIQTGVVLSRAKVQTYNGSMGDLRRVLEQTAKADRIKGRSPRAQRRFVVTEGLLKTTGEICPLHELLPLLQEFKYRLLLDESHSFGTLGATGLGVTELCQTPATEHVIRIVSLETALGSIGALTVGVTQDVVDHQRLCGAGYCFSASSPPFTAQAALAALELVPSVVPQLAANIQYMVPRLQDMLHTQLDDLLEIASDVRSPIVILKVADIPETEYLHEVVFLQEVAQIVLERGKIGLVATESGTLRLTISALHTTADMDAALRALGQAVDVVMNRFHDEDDVVEVEE